MTTPKKHHYVPVAHLRNFSIANDPDRIYVYDKSKDRQFPSRLQDTACESNFNTVDIGGQKVNLEKLFDQIDNDTPPLFRKILEKEDIDQLTPGERYGIAVATAVQVLRVKIMRTSLIDFMRQLGVSLQSAGISPEGVENFRIPDEEEAKLLSLQNLPLVSDLANILAQKICVLHKTFGEPFWISDNPVVTFNPFPYGQNGLASQGVEVYFPISKDLLFAFYCPTIGWKLQQALAGNAPLRDPDWHRQLFQGMLNGRALDSSGHVEFFNSLQVARSYRFVFGSKNDFSLAQDMVSRNPELSRVDGMMRAGGIGTIPKNDRMPAGKFLVLTGQEDHLMLPVESWSDKPSGAEFEVQVEKAHIPQGLIEEEFFVTASFFEDGYELRMVRGARLEFREAGEFYNIQVRFHDESMNQLSTLIRGGRGESL